MCKKCYVETLSAPGGGHWVQTGLPRYALGGGHLGVKLQILAFLLAWGELKGECATSPRRVILQPGTCNQEIPDLEAYAVAKYRPQTSAICSGACDALQSSPTRFLIKSQRSGFRDTRDRCVPLHVTQTNATFPELDVKELQS